MASAVNELMTAYAGHVKGQSETSAPVFPEGTAAALAIKFLHAIAHRTDFLFKEPFKVWSQFAIPYEPYAYRATTVPNFTKAGYHVDTTTDKILVSLFPPPPEPAYATREAVKEWANKCLRMAKDAAIAVPAPGGSA